MKTLKNFISKDTQILSTSQTNQINGGEEFLGVNNIQEGFIGMDNVQEGLIGVINIHEGFVGATNISEG